MKFPSIPSLLLLSTAAVAMPTATVRDDSTTRNDIKNGLCAPVSVIFARGTIEAGNVGSIAGPPFFNALTSAIGNIAVQGVDYPADIIGYLAGGSDAGAQTMTEMVELALSNCPDTRIVMSGYSQGGQLTHKSAAEISAATAAKVFAVVIFGDPDRDQALANGLDAVRLTICHSGDLICDGDAIVLPQHLTYGEDAGTAAAFVKSKL
ncbi:cutinase [Sphaerosporella brunnea]|uniref:Cutinase n=1 Tax=Sphaerosporella brunnea TaxID=1250544 RepID=A0A5J5F936_9PEZI|nr:cutinase [Sphaerosporella brunnea]